MNPIDLYKVWQTFNHMIEDPAFDVQAKQAMGVEMIQALPPEMLWSVSKSSLNAVKAAMKSRLTNLSETKNDNPSTERRAKEEGIPSSSRGKVRKPRGSSTS